MPTQPKLPVITFNTETLNRDTDTESWLSTAHAVREALENYGCFIVGTNKIPSDLRDTIFELSKDLFDLPLETKIKNTSDLLGFGYGHYSSLPLWEYFGIENAATIEATQRFADLLFPSGNKAFCESAYEYTKLLSDIHHYVLRMVFDSYGVESKECDHLIESTLYLARFMKYRTPNEGESGIGTLAHTDKSFLAVLDDNVKGLGIQMKNGEWIHPEPSPSTFIIIAGDPFKAWSNGRIYAPVHQVLMRASLQKFERYSMGLFSFMTATVEVPKILVENESCLRFRPFSNMDFLKYVSTVEGKEASLSVIESYCGNHTTDANINQ